jgi:hypothetical protein
MSFSNKSVSPLNGILLCNGKKRTLASAATWMNLK